MLTGTRPYGHHDLGAWPEVLVDERSSERIREKRGRTGASQPRRIARDGEGPGPTVRLRRGTPPRATKLEFCIDRERAGPRGAVVAVWSTSPAPRGCHGHRRTRHCHSDRTPGRREAIQPAQPTA